MLHYDTAAAKFHRVSTLQSEADDDDEVKQLAELQGNALFCLKPQNALRVMCYKLVESKWFKNTILVLIIISTITLALETPLDDPEGDKIRVLE